MTCRGTGLFRALREDHTLFPGSLTRKLYKKKIPEIILEVPGVPGTKERELAEKWGMTHETGSRVLSGKKRSVRIAMGAFESEDEYDKKKCALIEQARPLVSLNL